MLLRRQRERGGQRGSTGHSALGLEYMICMLRKLYWPIISYLLPLLVYAHNAPYGPQGTLDQLNGFVHKEIGVLLESK